MTHRVVNDTLQIAEQVYNKTSSHIDSNLTKVYLYLFLPWVFGLSLDLVWSISTDVKNGLFVAGIVFAFHEYMSKKVRLRLEAAFSTLKHKKIRTLLITISIVVVDLIIAVPMFGFGQHSLTYTERFSINIIIIPYLYLFGKLIVWSVSEVLSECNLLKRKKSIAIWTIFSILAFFYVLLYYPTIFQPSTLSTLFTSQKTEPISPLLLFALLFLSVDMVVITLVFLVIVSFLGVVVILLSFPPAILWAPSFVLGQGLEMPIEMRVWTAVSFVIVDVVILSPYITSVYRRTTNVYNRIRNVDVR